MPEESHPFYREKQLQGEEAQKLSELVKDISPNANLLGRKELFTKQKDVQHMIINTCKIVLLVLSMLLFGALKINDGYNSTLENLNNEKLTLMEKLNSYANENNALREIQRKTDAYKSIKQRRLLSDSVASVFEISQDALEMSSFSSTDDKFVVSATGTKPTAIVKVLYEILNSGYVSQLVLKAVDVDAKTGVYTLSLEGVYK